MKSIRKRTHTFRILKIQIGIFRNISRKPIAKIMDWIHCNKCYVRNKPGSIFYVTSCGHLKCQTCRLKFDSDQRCLVCNAQCDIVALRNLNSDLQAFFQPPGDYLDKAKQISVFQHTNALSLLKNLTAKYTSLKGELTKLYNNYQELKKTYEQTRRENMKLRNILKSNIRGNNANNLFMNASPASSLSSYRNSSAQNITMTPVSQQPGNQMQMPDPGFMARNTFRSRLMQPGVRGNPATSTPMMNGFRAPMPSLSGINFTPVQGGHSNPSLQNQGTRFMPRNASNPTQQPLRKIMGP